MSYDIGTVSFDFLDSFWNMTPAPTTSHTVSDGSSVGTLSRYQAMSVASLTELGIQRSELQGVQRQEWNILNQSYALGSNSVASCLD